MKFGRLESSKAEGSILAHSIVVHGMKWKKGRTLSDLDVEMLQSQGIETVVAARLEEGDVSEDVSAESLARAICGGNVELRPPATGRCNLYAACRGILELDRERLDRINAVAEAFTVAALPSHSSVYAGQLLASVKIIPFGVTREQLNDCINVAGAGMPAISVAPFQRLKIGLVQTRTDSFNSALLSKGERMLRERASQLESAIVAESVCEHHEADIAKSVREQLDKELDMILILGASAIQDRGDVVPQGIVDAGGRIDHFGMPVDPGNLLLLAHRGRTQILGVPGCARSPKRNGFDIVFERLAAGLEVLPEDVITLGIGGLLAEGPRRPERRTAAGIEAPADDGKRIAAVVLAAGRSRRMGKDNKLLMKLNGDSVIRLVVSELLRSRVSEVVVVTGHERELIQSELDGLAVTFAHNQEYAKGLSTSLRTALNAISQDVAGVLVSLGDMPYVRSSHVNALIDEFDAVSGNCICVPTCEGKRGNPVLWSKRYMLEMMEVRGDVGAKHMIGDYEEHVKEVDVGDRGVVVDLDTPEAFERLRRMD